MNYDSYDDDGNPEPVPKTSTSCMAMLLLLALLAVAIVFATGCNLVKKSQSSKAETTDSSHVQKQDSTAVKSTTNSESNAENWWKLYAMDRAGQPANTPAATNAVYVPGQTVYMPGQPYLIAEGGSKNSSKNETTYDSSHLIKLDSSNYYKQLLADEQSKTTFRFPWWQVGIGAAVLLAVFLFFRSFQITKK